MIGLGHAGSRRYVLRWVMGSVGFMVAAGAVWCGMKKGIFFCPPSLLPDVTLSPFSLPLSSEGMKAYTFFKLRT